MVIKAPVFKQLEDNYKLSGNQLYLLYGRTDSEKETMLRLFLKNKKHFYYRARQVSPEEQCKVMGREVVEKFGASLNKYTYEEYFNRIKSGDPSKLVVVIDEFQYIARKDKSFIDAIVKLKMKRLYPGPVMIVLCSSALSWVEKESAECLGEIAEKKLDARIKIENLNFLEVVRALPEYAVGDCIKTYGVIGGVPGYIDKWNSGEDLKQNICKLILSEDGALFGAAEEAIRSELRELSVYETILAYIASGYDKLNDLYLKTGFSRAKISVYMKNLSTFDIIRKVVSFETGGWENAKKGVYRIEDNYVNFWFHFIWPHLSELYMMKPEEFYDRYIADGLDAYLARYFKEVCMEYLELLNSIKKLPLDVKKMGTWVGKEGNIDIIAQNEIRQNLVGICNWEEPELTLYMCEQLFLCMRRAKISAEYYFLFSAKGFSQAVCEMAEKDKRFILVDMNEL